MKDETYDKGMVILGRVLKNLALTKEDIKTYRVLLDDLSDADFLSAIVEICQKTTEIYPGTNIVALIRQCARGGSKEDLHSRALLAWQNVIDTVERCGSWSSVQFDDPVIHSCVRALGGWIELCSTDVTEMVWREKKFLELYPVLSKSNQTHPKYLIGVDEKENRLNGYTEPMSYKQLNPAFHEFNPIPEPILIDTGIKQLPASKPIKELSK